MKARTGYACLVVAASSWGAWPLLLRRAERDGPFPATLESALVMATISLVALPFWMAERTRAGLAGGLTQGVEGVASHPGRDPFRWGTRESLLAIAALGLFDALNVLCFFRAYQSTTVAIAVLTHYVAPIFVTLSAPLVLGERADPRSRVALALSIGGLCLLLQPWHDPRAHGNDLIGAGFGLASAVFYAANVLLTKRVSARYVGSAIVFLHGLVAVPLLFAMVPRGAYDHVSPAAFRTLLIGAVGPGAMGALLFTWGLRRVPAAHASTLTLLEPLTATILSVVSLGESLGVVGGAGMVLVLFGALLVLAPRRTRV